MLKMYRGRLNDNASDVSMKFLRSRLLQAALILGVSFVVLRFALRPPAPFSVLAEYMFIILLATLVYVSADSDSWRSFQRPLRSTLVDQIGRAHV